MLYKDVIVIHQYDTDTKKWSDEVQATNVRNLKLHRLPYVCCHPLHNSVYDSKMFEEIYEDEAKNLDGLFYSGYEHVIDDEDKREYYIVYVRLCKSCYKWELTKDLIAS